MIFAFINISDLSKNKFKAYLKIKVNKEINKKIKLAYIL